MLRKIRITLAFVCFLLITLLFLDFTGMLHEWFGWLAKVQFLPAVLALNAGVVVGLVVLTLLFGRVYCSVICPLGVMQDVVSWLSGRRKGKKYRFSWSPAISWLRYGVLAVFIAALIAEIGSHHKRASVLLLAGVVLAYQVVGTLGEWAMKGDFFLAVQDFRIGLPGMLVQIAGGWLVINHLIRK